ncbi:MAG: sulfatase [Verrucomicrobiales bacterium]|nr:sulfatase [Verrucomicrobiales bacterium]
MRYSKVCSRERAVGRPPRALTGFLAVFVVALSGFSAAVERPDVLFIAVDDMNDWISLLDPDSPIKTPNLERLAARGMSFTRAYCVSPACNPSRVATITGLRPSTSGVYGNKSDWRRALPDRLTLFQQFREVGYFVAGAGKIFHHHLDGAFHDDASFESFEPMREQLYPETKLNGAPEYGSPNTDWGVWPPHEKDSIDFGTVEAAKRILREAPDDRPLFLACGIFKPHSPFFAPQEWHEETPLPLRKEDDWDDLPTGAETLLERPAWFWKGMMELEEKTPGSYQRFINSYAAACRYADAKIGEVIDALDNNPRASDTIIVLWSDHGFHLGEKNHIEKFTLWEKANRVPFIVVAPGVTEPGTTCDRPVDLSVLYPTLLDLAGLPADDRGDGVSIVPLLKNPAANWDRPAIMTYLKGNHAVRTDRWRYIQYADGTEELYDHKEDPHEWENLADEAGLSDVVAEHRKWIPTVDASEVPLLRKP